MVSNYDSVGAGTDLAFLAAVGGALADAAASGDPDSSETAMSLLKQIVNVLQGTAGIAAWPGEAAPANGVSIAEVIEAIHADVTAIAGAAMRGTDDAALASIATETRLAELDGANLPADIDTIKALVDAAEAVGPFSYLDAGGEQTVVEETITTRRRVSIEFDLTTMTQNGTIRLKRKVDGTTLRVWSETAFLQAGAENVFDFQFTTNQAWRLTYQEAVDETADRAIPFNVITEVIE